MDNEQLKAKILSVVPNAEVAMGKQYLEAIVAPHQMYSLAKALKEDNDTHFDYLFCLTGMDWPDGLGVIYHLTSTQYTHILVLKTKTSDRKNPSLDSVCDLWKTADFLEREVYDLFGINFKNHPDMRRIFLDESWEGYPLRKDYVDQIRITEK